MGDNRNNAQDSRLGFVICWKRRGQAAWSDSVRDWFFPYRLPTETPDILCPRGFPLVRNCTKHRGSTAAHLMQPALAMINERPGMQLPLDEERLQLVREFLRREFRGGRHRDYFEFHTTTQVFVIETEQGLRYTLVIPKRTVEDGDFRRLLNQQLVTALELAPGARIRLTPRGPRE